MSFEGMKKAAKIAALSTLAVTVQPQTNPDHPSTKPVGIRDAVKKIEGVNGQIQLLDGRVAIIDDGSRKKEPSKDSESAET
jgi:hypothetical protein